MKELQQLHRIVEGILFASSAPLSLEQISSLFEENQRPDKKQLKQVLFDLADDYKTRGVELVELASGFQFQVQTDLSKWVNRLWEEKPQKYSRAFLETLALIAYRQPITRGEIAEIRGVNVNSLIIKSMLELEWIQVAGHREAPGRPALFSTTKQFLDDFGLKAVEELPALSEVTEIDETIVEESPAGKTSL